jgi:Family of unknown function (DUF5908)
MPIEIKELNIRINLNQNQQEQDDKPPQSSPQTQGGGAERDELLAECVEQVMELLKNKLDR